MLAFSRRAVPRAAITEVLEVARRAPSGVNTQPWNVFVLQGKSLAALAEAVAGVLPGLLGGAAGQAAFWEQFNRHPGTGHWPAGSPLEVGDEALSVAMAQADGQSATPALEHYFRFFDAPVGLVFTVSGSLGLGSLLDYGMFLQSITLAARARGLQTCIQPGWKGLADTVLAHLDAPDDGMVVCGMAMGYADTEQAPVHAPVELASAAAFTTWHG